MSAGPPPEIGTEMSAPGFRGVVVGALTGPLTVIAAELEGEMETHVAESDEMGVVLEGRVRVTMGDVVRILLPGDHVIVPKGTEHAVCAEIPSRLLLLGAV